MDHLESKTPPPQDNSGSPAQPREIIYSGNLGDSKVDSSSNLMFSRDRSKFAGKIYKKTDPKLLENGENRPDILSK